MPTPNKKRPDLVYARSSIVARQSPVLTRRRGEGTSCGMDIPPGQRPATNAPEFTVSEISAAVKRTIEGDFAHVRVRGEVGRLTRPRSGHVYFDLKDENAVLNAVAWKGMAARWRFQPEQGLEVIVTGRLTTFPGQSKYQIIVESVEPAGIGALMALLEERRKKLAAEGLFASERKRPLPYLPKVVGVVTSPTGAVIRDILHRLSDRCPTHVLVWPVRVQGETCATEVAAAISGFNALSPDGPIPRPDLLIVARGGGSVEDLWGFNEESVVRAAAASTIPLISAVGHETDTTLIDHAADRRAPTPTGAAEMAVPVKAELIAGVENHGSRQRIAVRRALVNLGDRLRAAGAGLPRPADILSTARQRLDHATSRLEAGLAAAASAKHVQLAHAGARLGPTLLRRRREDMVARLGQSGTRLAPAIRRKVQDMRLGVTAIAQRASPRALQLRTEEMDHRLEHLSVRLAPSLRRQLAERGQTLDALFKLLNSMNYENVVARGYAVIWDANDKVISSRTSVSAGDAVRIEFADGTIGAVIGEGGDPSGGPPGPKSRTRKTKARKPDDDEDRQSSLF